MKQNQLIRRLTRSIIAVLLAGQWCLAAKAQTLVTNDIATNTVWVAMHSPYTLAKTVVNATNGGTLTI